MPPKRLKAIACEVVYREMCYCAAISCNVVDLQFISQGLHDVGSEKMSERLQAEIDAADADLYDAVVLGYALCNNGIVGLRARKVPLVVPRAHDCITFFFGSDARYQKFFDEHPGTYFATTGWRERDETNIEDVSSEAKDQLGLGRTFEEYVAKYGEDNAKYLMETLGDTTRNYSCLAYIDMGVQESLGYDKAAEKRASDKGWDFVRMKGDLTLMKRLVDGEWDDDSFLIVQPGEQIAATYDGGILKTCPIEQT
jgi:uncharacterized protein DUF1638